MKAKKLTSSILTMLFLSICAISIIDTKLFVYPSLSRSLMLEIGIMTMALVSLCICMKRKVCLVDSIYDVFLLVWITYIILRYCLTQPHEIYRTLYLVITLLLALVVKNVVKCGLVSKSLIEIGLISIAILHLFYIILQVIGFINSPNEYFTYVGAAENPTVTALYLAGILPLLVTRSRQKKNTFLYIVLIALTIIGIILLKCRTAYIGGMIAIIAYTFIYNKEKIFRFFKQDRKKYVGIIILAILLSLLTVHSYKMKKDSADGRLLIWKLTTEMMTDNPKGYGYGLFEKFYNFKQADYFYSGIFTAEERQNANFVYMPYNDFLEQGVEGGVVGLVFLLLFYTLMIRKAVKEDKVMEAITISIFGIMSMTNFVYTSIQPWLLLMCIVGFVLTEKQGKQPNNINANMLLCVCFGGIMTLMWHKVYVLVCSQIELKKLATTTKTTGTLNDSCYALLESRIGSSEVYWTWRANNNMKNQNFVKAKDNLRKARLYSSSPKILRLESICQLCEGYTDKSISYIDTLSMMQPHKLTTKLQLMRYYLSVNMIQKAMTFAHAIVETGAKKETIEARKIIEEANDILKKYEK